MDPYLPNEEFVQNLRRALQFGQVNRNLLKSGTGVNLQGNAAYPASTMFVENFQRAIATGTITNAQIANPSLITNIDTYAPADASFVLECNRAGAFGQLATTVT
jgi:hypothetical protein